MAGVQENGEMVYSYTNSDGGFGGALEFPVTLSEDHQTITIHPLESNGATWYPNVVGESTGLGGAITYILENPIVSEVVLTKGWTEPEAEQEQTPATRSASRKADLKLVGNQERAKYTPMTDLRSVRVPVRIETQVTTLEKVEENFKKFRKEHANRFGK